MHHDSVTDGGIYLGALFFVVMIIMFNGFSELALTIIKLPVFFKHRGLLFFSSMGLHHTHMDPQDPNLFC
jgi:hypothetical protein